MISYNLLIGVLWPILAVPTTPCQGEVDPDKLGYTTYFHGGKTIPLGLGLGTVGSSETPL